MILLVSVGGWWGAVCMWPAWGVGAGCLCAYTYRGGIYVWYMGGVLSCVWKCNKGVCDSTTVCDVYSMEDVWDGVV